MNLADVHVAIDLSLSGTGWTMKREGTHCHLHKTSPDGKSIRMISTDLVGAAKFALQQQGIHSCHTGKCVI